MAVQKSWALTLFTPFLIFSNVFASTVNLDFNVTWVRANPDGMYERAVIGINNQWPIPQIHVDVGDRLILNMDNQLGNESTSLHFHGLFQNGTTHMDGPTQVSQCEVPPGSSFTYNFTIDQPGTYWYHSHSRGQYPDGLRGAFVVHDPESPFKGQYEEEKVVTISDWYHDSVPNLMKKFISVTNPTGAEPVPEAALMNDTQNLEISVETDKTYLFRFINIGAFASHYLWIEDHNMTIVEVDGVYTHPTTASMIYLTTAQRYSVLVTTKSTSGSNFAIVSSMDEDLFDTVPESLNPNVTSWLIYNSENSNTGPAEISEFDPYDDFGLVPWDNQTMFQDPSQSVELVVSMNNLGDGANYAFFNNITYVAPTVPTLYTVLSSGGDAINPVIYGGHTHPFVLEYGQVIEIVVNNDDPGKHPFHLHGHNFQVVWRSEEEAGHYDPDNFDGTYPAMPMRRDTILLRPNGNAVLRFYSDNPGVWLFHCHIEWHVSSGLIATFVEAPVELQQQLGPVSSLPADHLGVCAAMRIPTSGNAAGNTKDLLDLTGQPSPPNPLPTGFTARGIVALVFSTIAAFVGMGFIGWYGVAPLAN